MVDTVNTQVVFDGQREYTVNLINISDGTGESAVKKVDVSTLTPAPNTLTLLDATWIVSRGNVRTFFDATTDDEMLTCAGTGFISYEDDGGLTDPATTGTTGDIMLTTNGFVSGDTYTIKLRFRKNFA